MQGEEKAAARAGTQAAGRKSANSYRSAFHADPRYLYSTDAAKRQARLRRAVPLVVSLAKTGKRDIKFDEMNYTLLMTIEELADAFPDDSLVIVLAPRSAYAPVIIYTDSEGWWI